MRTAPRQGWRGSTGELEGIARPGWLAALLSPPDGGEEDGDGVAALLSPWAMLRAGDVVSAGDGVDV